VDPTLLKEYALERYKNGDDNRSNSKKPDLEEFKSKAPVFKEKLTLPSIAELPDDHYAKAYVLNRMIPEERHSELYYAEDYKKFVEAMKIEKDGLIDNDPRLVIPFYDEDKNLVAFQGRALGNSKLRYITVKVDSDNYKVYGMDRIDKEKKILVVEGPIDSMFLENCVATADSNLPAASRIYNKADIVLIYDNEPRNKDIVRQIEKAIEEHYNVVIWPDMMEEKDVNDMILSGFSPDEIQDIITKHTYQNLRAKMEFINWKKV
jgi:hypothetical protein